MHSRFQTLLRGLLENLGAPLLLSFNFYCIFITKFFEVFRGGTLGAVRICERGGREGVLSSWGQNVK